MIFARSLLDLSKPSTSADITSLFSEDLLGPSPGTLVSHTFLIPVYQQTSGEASFARYDWRLEDFILLDLGKNLTAL